MEEGNERSNPAEDGTARVNMGSLLLRCMDVIRPRCHMEDDIRWTVKVSRDTDVALRSFLAQRGLRKGELSRFVERAVRKEVLAQTAAALKARNQDIPYPRLQSIVDEAVAKVRSESGSRRRRK